MAGADAQIIFLKRKQICLSAEAVGGYIDQSEKSLNKEI
jgi:hypothetical protein